MTIETMDDLPETPLQDVKPARGRFNNGNVMPLLERFYPGIVQRLARGAEQTT